MAAKYSYKVWEHFAHYANPILNKKGVIFCWVSKLWQDYPVRRTLSGMGFPDWENVATPRKNMLRPTRGSLRPYRVDFCEVWVWGLGFRVWAIYFL